MNLSAYVDSAVQTGHNRYAVASPRGYELARGVLTSGEAESIAQLCKEDAATLDRSRVHEYVLSASSDDGAKSSRFAIRVAGGQDPEAEHRVDVASTSSPGAVIGHLTRIIVEQQKAILGVAKDAMTLCKGLNEELEKTRRKTASLGQHAVTARIVELQHEERKEQSARSQKLLGEVVGLAMPLAARFLGPAGKDAAWSRLKEQLTPEQLRTVSEVLGPVRMGQLMALSSADKACGFLVEQCRQEELVRVSAVLTEEQQALLGAALQDEMKRREAVDKGSSEPKEKAAE